MEEIDSITLTMQFVSIPCHDDYKCEKNQGLNIFSMRKNGDLLPKLGAELKKSCPLIVFLLTGN